MSVREFKNEGEREGATCDTLGIYPTGDRPPYYLVAELTIALDLLLLPH